MAQRKEKICACINDNDLVLSPEMQKKIEEGLQEIKEGKGKEYSLEELRKKRD
jgi:hypothetical protein